MEGKNSSIPLDEFEKQSIEDTERHFIGNILLDQETEEFGHEWPEKDVIEKVGDGNNRESSVNSGGTSDNDNLCGLTISGRHGGQQVTNSIAMAAAVAAAHHQQQPSHNIYQLSGASPNQKHYDYANAALFAVVSLGTTSAMNHQSRNFNIPPSPPPSYSTVLEQQKHFPPFQAIGSSGQISAEFSHDDHSSIGRIKPIQRPIPKLSAIRFENPPESKTLWSSKAKQPATANSSIQNVNKQKPQLIKQRSSELPTNKKQILGLKKSPKEEKPPMPITPPITNRPIGFNPIEPRQKNEVKTLIGPEMKLNIHVENKTTDSFQKVSNNATRANLGQKTRRRKKCITTASAQGQGNQSSPPIDEVKNLKLNAPSSRFEVLSRIGRSSPNKPTMTNNDIIQKPRSNSVTSLRRDYSDTASGKRSQESNKKIKPIIKASQVGNLTWTIFTFFTSIIFFVPRLLKLTYSNLQSNNGIQRGTNKKNGLKNKKSILQHGLVIMHVGWNLTFGTILWIGKLIINIVGLSLVAIRISLKRALRRLPIPTTQPRNQATVKNGRLHWTYET